MFNVTTLAAVAAMGGLGAVLRVLLAGWVDARWSTQVPHVGTWVVNMLGCFAIGIATVAIPAGAMRLVVLGGLLGGFTTYSAFALFTQELMANQRYAVMALQVCAHVFGGVAMVLAGLVVARMFSSAT